MNISILGAGTWGTALARMLCLNGHKVTLWSALSDEIAVLSSTRTHPKLPQMTLPKEVILTTDISDACREKQMILVVVTSVYVRSVTKNANPYIENNTIIVNLAKGIEPVSFKSMTDIISEEITDCESRGISVVALSGPTHAEEVAKNLPTAIVSACSDADIAETVQKVFSNDTMRVYTNNDIRGVELCGAMKNIIALASGMTAGLGYGDNTKAALITRGMSEITRLGKAMHCDERTFYGLAGVGDLIVTATSVHSRNNRAGFLIGSGMSVEKAVKEVGMAVEGINAIPAAIGLAEKYGVELPIVFAVNDIIYNGAEPAAKVLELMTREYKNEA